MVPLWNHIDSGSKRISDLGVIAMFHLLVVDYPLLLRCPSYRGRTTKNLRAVQLLLGHTKLESTVRYLGIELDDALEIAEQTEV